MYLLYNDQIIRNILFIWSNFNLLVISRPLWKSPGVPFLRGLSKHAVFQVTPSPASPWFGCRYINFVHPLGRWQAIIQDERLIERHVTSLMRVIGHYLRLRLVTPRLPLFYRPLPDNLQGLPYPTPRGQKNKSHFKHSCPLRRLKADNCGTYGL